MKIQLMSDLHLEFDEQQFHKTKIHTYGEGISGIFKPKKTNADVLVLAGDIHVGIKAKDWILERLREYDHVIYLPGNHEYYGHVMEDIDTDLEEMAQTLNKMSLGGKFYLLNDDSIVIDDVLLVGSTLWTDFNGGSPISGMTVERNLNDFRLIKRRYISSKTDQSKTKRINYGYILERHNSARKFIQQEVDRYSHIPKKILVTHHAPSRLSTPEEFKTDYHMNGGYSSNCHDLVEKFDLAIHGHTHTSFDYKIPEGTRVVCNPRGYSPFALNEEFKEDLVIEV